MLWGSACLLKGCIPGYPLETGLARLFPRGLPFKIELREMRCVRHTIDFWWLKVNFKVSNMWNHRETPYLRVTQNSLVLFKHQFLDDLQLPVFFFLIWSLENFLSLSPMINFDFCPCLLWAKLSTTAICVRSKQTPHCRTRTVCTLTSVCVLSTLSWFVYIS